MRENQRYTKGMFSWIGYRKKELLFDRQPRHSGNSKFNYYSLINLAIEGITSFSVTPLRIASLLGILTSLMAFFYLLFTVAKTLFLGADLAGYPSLMAVILFLGGAQLLALGIIGEYIGRIFNETKQRPLYLVESSHRVSHEKTHH